MKNSINIVLLGLDFNSGNFGCSALGYSFLNILKNISEKNNIHMKITSVNYHNFFFKSPNLNVENIQIKYKSISFYNKYIKKIKSADLVYDFTGGDSFTDIYGNSRFYKETLLKALVIIFKKKLIIGPQTIGPFNNKITHYIAKKIMSKSYKNYTRDNISKQFVEDMNIPITQVTDIAFLLPKSDDYVTKIEKNVGKKIGINISGLLFNGGYSGNNDFNLKIDYKEYCKLLIKYLLNLNYKVYLIPHVISSNNIEDDFINIKKLNKIFPETIVAPKFKNPMQAKKYISEMDFFIGSRMHATVAAYSTGVPMVAIAYSRKFEGLFGTLNYPYIIDARKMDTESAVNKTLEWVNNSDELKKCLHDSIKIMKNTSDIFILDTEELIIDLLK